MLQNIGFTDQADFVYAYRCGQRLASRQRYQHWTWEQVEPIVRRQWAILYQDKCRWETFRSAVRHSWLGAR